MTEKRYNRLVSSIDYYYCIDTTNDDKGLTEKDMLNLLNEQYKRIKELEKENASMKGRIINAIVKSNQVECNCSPCICEDYVKEELKNWRDGNECM